MQTAQATLNQCLFPDLPEPYRQALREAVEFILYRFDAVLGVLASGTIIRGTPDASSDLDVYVLHDQPSRQRLQRYFNGVPAEIFVNPPETVERYFVQEQAVGRPLSAHMFATGVILWETSSVVTGLKQQAQNQLAQPPTYSVASLIRKRYSAATWYEDARDVLPRDPAAARLLLSQAVFEMLQYAFMQHGQFIPRYKELLAALSGLDTGLADTAQAYFTATDLEQQFVLAERLAERTLQTSGFFEWESALEPVQR